MNNANQPWDFGRRMFRHSLHKPLERRANQPLQISPGSVREKRRPHRELGAVKAGEQTQGWFSDPCNPEDQSCHASRMIGTRKLSTLKSSTAGSADWAELTVRFRLPYQCTRSCKRAGSRAVASTLSPAASAASAMVRPPRQTPSDDPNRDLHCRCCRRRVFSSLLGRNSSHR